MSNTLIMHLFQQHGFNYDNNEENDVRSFMNVIDKELAKTKLMLKSANLLCKENYGRTSLFTTTEHRNKNAENHMENVSRQLESTRYALLERIRNNKRMNKQKSLNEKMANGDGRNMLVLLKNIEDEFWDTVDDLKSWNRNRGKKQLSLQNINEILVRNDKNENEEYGYRGKSKNEISSNNDTPISITSLKNENSDSKSEISDSKTDNVCMYVLYLNEPNNMDNVKIYKSKMKMPQEEFEKIVNNNNSKKRLDRLWSSKEEVDFEEREKVLCNARLLVSEINEEENNSNRACSSLEHLSDSDTHLEDSKDNHDSRTLQSTLAASIDSGFNDSMQSILSSPVINYLSSSTESVLSTIESESSFIETTEEILYECSSKSKLELPNIDEEKKIASSDSLKNDSIEQQLNRNLEVFHTIHPNTKIKDGNSIINKCEQIQDDNFPHNKDLENNSYLSDQELFKYENNINPSDISNRTITTNYNDVDGHYSNPYKQKDSKHEITNERSYPCSENDITDESCSSKTIDDLDKMDVISFSQESNKDNIFVMKTENIVKGSAASPDSMLFFHKISNFHPDLESDKKFDENSNNRFDEVENEFLELEEAIKEATKHFDKTIKQTEKTTFEIENESRDLDTSFNTSLSHSIKTERSTCCSDSQSLETETIFSESTPSSSTDKASLKNIESKRRRECNSKNDSTKSSLLTVDTSPTNAKHDRVASFDSSTSPYTMEITRSFNVESINGGGVSNTESESEKENNDSRFPDVRGIENKLYDLTNIFDWVSDAEDLDEKETDLLTRETAQMDNVRSSELPPKYSKEDKQISVESGFDTYISQKPPVVRKRTSVVSTSSDCQNSLKNKPEDIDVLEKIYASQNDDCVAGTEKWEDIREIGKQYGVEIYEEDNRSESSSSSHDKHDKQIEEILEKQKNRVEYNKKNQIQSCDDKNVEKIHGSQLMDEVCFVVFFLLYFRMVLESRSRPGGLPVIQEEDSFDILSEEDEEGKEEDTKDEEDVTDDKQSDTSSNGTAYYSAISGKTDPDLERYLSTSCSIITPDTEIGDLGVNSPIKNRFNAVKSPIVTGDRDMYDIDMEETFVSASTVFEYDFSKFESLHSESDESGSQLGTASSSNSVMKTVSQTPILDAAKEWLKSGLVIGETTEVDALSDTMSDTSSSISITERIDQLLGESFDFFNSSVDLGNTTDKRIVTEIEINETDDELANYFDSALQTTNQNTGNTRTVPGDFRELNISNNIQTIENIDENEDVAHCNMVYDIDTVDKKPEENDFENLYLVQNSIPDGSSGSSSPENDEESSRITTPDSDQNDGDFFDISTPEEEDEYYALDNQRDNEDDKEITDNIEEFNVQKVAQEMSQLARMLGRKVSEEASEGLSVIYEVEGEDSSESECRVNKVFELTEDTDESDRFDKVYGIEGIKEFSTDIGPHNKIVGNSSGFDRKYKDDVVDVRLTEFEKLYLVEKGNEFSEDASDIMYDTLDEESKASSVEGSGIVTRSEKKRMFKGKYSNSNKRKKLLERKDSLELDRTESDISEYVSEDGIYYSDDSLDSAEELKDEVWVQGSTVSNEKTEILNIDIDHNESGLIHVDPSPIDSLNGEQLTNTFVSNIKPPTDSISEEQLQKTFKQSNSPRVEIFPIDEEDSLTEDATRCSASTNHDVIPTNESRTSAREYKDAETKSRVDYWKQKVADISRQNNLSKR